MKLLNVGSGSKSNPIPASFAGWDVTTLDIDPRVAPDICLDARKMKTLPPSVYDAVLSSHCLEHFYRHEVKEVLEGFHHVLKDKGFAEIIVPNIGKVIQELAQKSVDDVAYESAAGPIRYHDMIYGHQGYVASGNQFYAHKTGFDKKALCDLVLDAGFKECYVDDSTLNLFVRAIK